MRTRPILAAAALLLTCAVSGWGWTDNRFASNVVSYANLGSGVYSDPAAVLGGPATWVAEPGGPGVAAGTYAVSLVFAAYNTAPDGSKVVTTVGTPLTSGEIIVEFAEPVVEDPAHWYGKEFIVFGNAIFKSNGYVSSGMDMETYSLNNGTINSGPSEPLTVSVSPDLVNWYTYSSPKSDSYWPTNAFAWNRITHDWGEQLDPTKPVDPALDWTSFAGMFVADAVDRYKGSAGGTAFDLAESGFTSVKYIKLSGTAGEVDAISRVGRPLSIGQAKQVPDGTAVSLGPQVVTAGTEDLGDCFYIESTDRSSGIKVTGAAAARGTTVTVTGVIDTVGGERVLTASWAESGDPASVAPLGMPNKSVHGSGISSTGLLVTTWGQVKSVDAAASAFTVSDGSGPELKCTLPAGSDLPVAASYVSVTGISTLEQGVPVLRARGSSDVHK